MFEKYALVVGCNYKNSTSALRGCINDATSMHDILIRRFGFKNTHVKLLTDEESCKDKPTAGLIKGILKEVLSVTKAGDLVVLYFAGHGTIVPAISTATHKDEQAIVASDFNLITSVDFRKILNGAPEGVDFVIVSDSCHSGGLIDKEKEQIGPARPPVQNLFGLFPVNFPIIRMISFEVLLQQLVQLALNIQFSILNIPAFFLQLFGADCSLIFQNVSLNSRELRPLKADQGILLSGCQPNEKSGEKQIGGKYHGVFTSALLDVFKKHPKPITNRELVVQARKFVEKLEEKQHPCLYCGDKNVVAFFLRQY